MSSNNSRQQKYDGPPLGLPLREFLKNLMVNIYNLIPEKDNDSILMELRSKLDSLFYTAPEILGNFMIDIHLILQKYIPLNEQNPPWVDGINTIWQQALKDYKTFKTSE